MSTQPGHVMVEAARRGGYAIGAFSAHNAETTKAILAAAEAERAPVMIQIGQKAINTLGLREMKCIVDAFVETATVPVCVHLDHSRQLTPTLQAVREGFDSVMFDGSGLDFEENTRLTSIVSEVAHAVGVGCEGEIGKIGGTEDDLTVDEADALITTVEEAERFAKATNVDFLAVSVGTAHGVYRAEPTIHLDRIAEISAAVDRPLVLHGGSGVPDEHVAAAVARGVAKVNVDTELRQAFTRGVQAHWATHPDDIVLADSLGAGIASMQEVVQQKIRLLGSAGRAA